MQNEAIYSGVSDFTLPLDSFEIPSELNENSTEPSAKPWKLDPYTISEDGHVVGQDGFVVPKDFAEFYERFPQHVRNFVHAHWTHASDTDREDREHELLLHLMTLPADSKFRQPGYNGIENGCEDRIQVFHPDSAYGASAKRFFWYINHCLRNHYFSQGRKAISNPVRRASTMSLNSADAAGEIIDEEYVFSRISKEYSSGCNYNHMLVEGVIVNEFLEYVEEHNPELISVLDVIGAADTFVDAQRMLGMSEKLFLRARNRLVVLHKHFLAGEVPPRQRKVYKSRKDAELPQAAKRAIVAFGNRMSFAEAVEA